LSYAFKLAKKLIDKLAEQVDDIVSFKAEANNCFFLSAQGIRAKSINDRLKEAHGEHTPS